MIGEGGVNLWEDICPSIHYVFKEEYWGKGYATEFVKAFMGFWWNLPHKDTHIKLRASIVDYQVVQSKTTEFLFALTFIGNDRCEGVLKKEGFKLSAEMHYDNPFPNNGMKEWIYRSP